MFSFFKSKKKRINQNTTNKSIHDCPNIERGKSSLPEKPSYAVRGKLTDEKIHLGSYFLHSEDREEIYLVFTDDAWFIQSEAMWPVHRGASNGGQSKNKLDANYFITNNICTLDDLLSHIYRGNLAPCREILQKNNDVLMLMEELLKKHTVPNYVVDEISLLIDFNDDHTGIVIHKCFSVDKDIINIPDFIENYPVVEFGKQAFVGMNCRKIRLPNTLKNVYGIGDCKQLREITIPASAEKCCSFNGCNSLENIFVSDQNKYFSSDDGVLYTYDKKTLIRCPEGKKGMLKMSDKTTSTGSWACSSCKLLTDITISYGLTEIGMDSFANCTNIKAFYLPDSIVEISWGAFANIDRKKIFCKEGSYAYEYLENNFSNPHWHYKY